MLELYDCVVDRQQRGRRYYDYVDMRCVGRGVKVKLTLDWAATVGGLLIVNA